MLPRIGAAATVLRVEELNVEFATAERHVTAVRNFSPSTTDAVDDVLTGEGTSAVVLPTFAAPVQPELWVVPTGQHDVHRGWSMSE